MCFNRLPMRAIRTVAMTLVVLPSLALAEQSPASQFLAAVSTAVNEANYRGTLVRSASGRIDAMRILHSFDDGFVREKLVSLDGEGREIIRHGSELICFLPARKMKIVDASNVSSNAFSRLQTAGDEPGLFYSLVARGRDRVSGRRALRYDLRPSDDYRYEHRFWVDAATSLPLRMQLVDRKRVIEEIRFVDIEIGVSFEADAFDSAIDSRGFSVMQGATPLVDDSDVANLPVNALGGVEDALGFRLKPSEVRVVEINGRRSQRMVFSDGLSSVSVYLEQRPGQARGRATQMASIGAAHTYQQSVDGMTVTVVGEVPAQTVRALADRARQAWSSDMSRISDEQ